MRDIASGTVTATNIIVIAVVQAHILTGLLHCALDTHLLHIGVGRYFGLNVVALEYVCQRHSQHKEGYYGHRHNDC